MARKPKFESLPLLLTAVSCVSLELKASKKKVDFVFSFFGFGGSFAGFPVCAGFFFVSLFSFLALRLQFRESYSSWI